MSATDTAAVATVPLPHHADIVIIGTGFAGLGLAVHLLRDGFSDVVLLERAGDVGGTWRDNTYPGAACDVPSNLYSFSFRLNPNWSRSFSPQPEIQDYLRSVAADYGVLPHIRFGTDVQGADWDDEAGLWTVTTSRGTITARLLVSAAGALSDPSIPDIPGLADFAGTVFHSARWDHSHDLTGERIAVIGTGASAIQFVPQIQKAAGRIDLYQRTPAWIMPRTDRPLTRLERWTYRRVPGAQRLVRESIYMARESFVLGFTGDAPVLKLGARIARRHLARQVRDPSLRAKLTPHYAMGCKRVLISNDFYPAVAQPNVDVITEGIAEVRPHSIVSSDGVEREVDTIIFGTGFLVTDQPTATKVRGRGGMTLDEKWQGSPKAFVGSTIPGFPNFFMLLGPNTGLGHTSQVHMIESQIEHVMRAVRHVRACGAARIEVRQETLDAFIEKVDREMEGSVWTTGGCKSWYLDRTGRNSTLWPGSTWRFRLTAKRFRPADFSITEPSVEPLGVPLTAG